MNKCEEMGIKHAWSPEDIMYGFHLVPTQKCLNCGLKRSKHSQIKEWWLYDDGRPNEEIITIRPV